MAYSYGELPITLTWIIAALPKYYSTSFPAIVLRAITNGP